EAEKDVPFRLFYVYRHLARPGPEGVEWLDLGIPTVGAKDSLSRRVKEALRDRDLLVGKIAPTRLLQKALREDEAEKPLRDVVEAFLRYPQLPMLEGDEVAWAAVRQGVQEGLFGVRVGGQVYFGEPLPALISPEEGVLVREVAPAVEGLPAGPSTPGAPGEEAGALERVAEPAGGPAATAGIGFYALRARVAWEKLSDLVRGVVMPLQQEADLEIEVSLRARGRGGGIRQGTLERVVKETLQQIRAEILEERLEETHPST
ncbi:MAG: ATP-binding protein, partial [Chloroflexia bacterium]